MLVWAVAVVLRLAFVSWQGITLTYDSDVYLQIARNLGQYGVFSGDAVAPVGRWTTRDPLFPFFLHLFMAAGLGGWALPGVALAQIGLDAFTACGVLMLGRRAGAERWALVAALLYCFHPGAVFYSTALLSETLCAALITAAAVLATLGEDKGRPAWTVAAGFMLGAAALCRTVVLLLPVVFAAVVAWAGWRERIGRAVLVMVFAAAAVLPWSVRTSRIAGKPVAVQEGGRALAMAYVASRGDLDHRDPNQVWAAWEATPEAQKLKAARTNEERRVAARAVRDRIVENILRAPGQFLVSRAKTIPRLFVTTYGELIPGNVAFGAAAGQGRWGLIAVKGAIAVTLGILPLLLAVIGIPKALGTASGRFATAIWVYFVLVHAPLWILPRYGQPAVPLLLVGAAIGARWMTGLAGTFLRHREVR